MRDLKIANIPSHLSECSEFDKTIAEVSMEVTLRHTPRPRSNLMMHALGPQVAHAKLKPAKVKQLHRFQREMF